jgi:carbonic anhydrase/acetyltransferase-like protein (isoleucine patch superfamily)
VSPRIHPSAFVAPGAVVVGDVEIGPESGIWYGCVVRGDVNAVRIGARTNIQDGTVIHVSGLGQGTFIGDEVTVGHMALVHACTVESRAFVGMKSCVMDGAHVEGGAMVAAGALVTPGKRVPSGEVWGGNPARRLREVRPEELEGWVRSWTGYVEMARAHAQAAGDPAPPGFSPP